MILQSELEQSQTDQQAGVLARQRHNDLALRLLDGEEVERGNLTARVEIDERCYSAASQAAQVSDGELCGGILVWVDPPPVYRVTIEAEAIDAEWEAK